ncbi:MAG: efflux RND transporter periplasmic adaptor subunit [Burkholderiales bacterium]
MRAESFTVRLAAALGAAVLSLGTASAQGTRAANEVRALVAADTDTTLVAPMAGVVLKVDTQLGANFSKGELLVLYDCKEPQARLGIAQAEIAAARETHEAKLRLQGMQQAGEVEVALAAAALEKARAQHELARVQADYCTVIAPFSGRAVKLHVKPFQGTTVGQPLLDVVSAGPVRLRMNAPSAWLQWLKPGTPFDVTVDETGRSFAAKVTAINGRVDAASQSVEIEGRVVQPVSLLPGMSGTARFKHAP